VHISLPIQCCWNCSDTNRELSVKTATTVFLPTPAKSWVITGNEVTATYCAYRPCVTRQRAVSTHKLSTSSVVEVHDLSLEVMRGMEVEIGKSKREGD
jgi:hypothetical protein